MNNRDQSLKNKHVDYLAKESTFHVPFSRAWIHNNIRNLFRDFPHFWLFLSTSHVAPLHSVPLSFKNTLPAVLTTLNNAENQAIFRLDVCNMSSSSSPVQICRNWAQDNYTSSDWSQNLKGVSWLAAYHVFTIHLAAKIRTKSDI